MDFHDTPEEAAFRAEVRAFIENECPPGIKRRGFRRGVRRRRLGRHPHVARGVLRDATAAWVKKLADHGWIAPAWPKEYGGAGMTVMEQFIFSQEMSLVGRAARRQLRHRHRLGRPDDHPPRHARSRRRSTCRGIVQGDEVWCQGFSEPGAGSDLAAVQTRAMKDGDDYVVNGQKIWTSGAHVAKYMILLARTDPEAPKHKGISYFIVDMKSPGIEVRPLVNMADNHDFNEVFFDNVRVPAKNMIGEENRGWYVGTTTLDFERSGIATSISHTLMVQDLATFVAREQGRGLHLRRAGACRTRSPTAMIEAGVEEMLCTQVISMQNRGLVPNKESSIAKLFSSELDVRIAGTAMHVLGLYGQLATRQRARAGERPRREHVPVRDDEHGRRRHERRSSGTSSRAAGWGCRARSRERERVRTRARSSRARGARAR